MATVKIFILSLDGRPVASFPSLRQLEKQMKDALLEVTPFGSVQDLPSYAAITASIRQNKREAGTPQEYIKTIYFNGLYSGIIRINRIPFYENN